MVPNKPQISVNNDNDGDSGIGLGIQIKQCHEWPWKFISAHDACKSMFKISRMASISIFIDKQVTNIISWYFSMKIAHWYISMQDRILISADCRLIKLSITNSFKLLEYWLNFMVFENYIF